MEGYGAVRQFERLIGYKGADTLYARCRPSPEFETDPSVSSILSGTAGCVGYVSLTGQRRFVSLEEEARRELTSLASALTRIASRKK